MKKFAVIVAGGSGLRMKISVPKQFLPLMGKPVLQHTLDTFLEAFDDMQVILVLPAAHMETGKAIAENSIDPSRIRITTGGETRFHSVQNGLKLVNQHSIVFVHDAVRCLISTALIHRCYHEAIDKGNAIPATTAVDTIRVEDFGSNHQIDRNRVRIIQTPQTFFSDIIKAAFEQEFSDEFTDEASVVEKLGVKINLVDGEETNIKITRPVDLLIAEKILEERYI